MIGMGLLALVAAGCSDSGASDGSGGTGTGGSGNTGGGGGVMSDACGSSADPFTVFAAEANNFTFQSSLVLDVQKVAPRTLLDFDWSALDTNFQGQPVSATADIRSVVLIVWDITPEEIAQKINEDATNLSSFVQGTVQFDTMNTATSANLADFTAFGSAVLEATLLDYLDPTINDPATHAYTLMAQEGDAQLGVGVQMIQAFQIDTAETTTTVTMSNASTVLDWEADLSMLTPTVVPAGQPGILIDWSEIETRGYGGEFIPNKITEVIIGRLGLTVPEIEQDFLNLEFIADDLWRGTVAAGVTFNLEDLVHDVSGEPFPGITPDETWILGLLCTTCTNPTPWYITKVEACP